MTKYNPSYNYSFRTRKTKKGVVYDIRFRIVNEYGDEAEKSLCGFQTKALAKQAYAKFIQSYSPPTKLIDTEKQVLKYDDAISQYFAAIKHQVKDSTYYDTVCIFKRFITPVFSGKPLSYLDKQHLYEWQDNLWAKKQSNGSPYSYEYLTKIRGFLFTFLQWVSDRYDCPNSLTSVKKPKRRQAVQKISIWEKKDFDRFFEYVDDIKWKTLFCTLYYSGCRLGEILALSEEDVQGEFITINKTYTRKTLDEVTYKITTTKNEKSRKQPIPKILQEQLKIYLEWKRQQDIPDFFLFGGKKPLSENSIRRAFDRYAEQAGLSRIRIHDIRHSYVSLLAHKGANLTLVAEMIGDTLDQVVKTYAHMYTSDKEHLVTLLD